MEFSDGAVATNTNRNKSREKLLAICFLKKTDLKRYLCLLEQLQESAYLGRDEYPQTAVYVYDTLTRFLGKFNSVGERYRQNLTRNQGQGKGKKKGAEESFAQAATGDG